MNQMNFGTLDFGNMLSDRRNSFGQTLESMRGFGNAMSSYYDRKERDDERKRRWDSVLELERQGQEALDAERRYNESVNRESGIQRNIDIVNRRNKELDGIRNEYEKAFDRRSRVARSMARTGDGYSIPEDAEYVESNGVNGYNFTDVNGNRAFAPMSGVVSGQYRDYGFREGNKGAFSGSTLDLLGINPHDRVLDGLYQRIGDVENVSTEGLEWQLGKERENQLHYQKAGAAAPMYRDPRYQAALASAKASNDPSAIYQYMNQYKAEEPSRQRSSTINSMRNFPIDTQKYGDMAGYLYKIMQTTQNPDEFFSAMQMLNSIMTQQDSEERSRQDVYRERRESDDFARDMRSYSRTDWRLADLGESLRDYDFDSLNGRDLIDVQKALGITRGLGRKTDETRERFNKAIEAYNEHQKVIEDLIGKYGEGKVYPAIDDSKREKNLRELLGYNSSLGSVRNKNMRLFR